MTIVNYDDVIRWLKFKRSINILELEDIEWVRDDRAKIKFDSKLIEQFKFIGLNNIDFANLFLSRVLDGEEKELLKELEWKDTEPVKIVSLRSPKIN